MSNSVLNYSQFLLEKKAINQEMAMLPKGKGSKSNTTVKPAMSELPKGKGKGISGSALPYKRRAPKWMYKFQILLLFI